MVNFHKYSVFGTVIYSRGIFTFLLSQDFLARGNKNGTVLDLLVICEKKGTIKYSNKIDKFCQIAELSEFEVK